MAADWDTSGIHERRVDERMAPEPRRGFLGGFLGGWLGGRRRRMAGALTGLVSVAIIAAYIWSGNDRSELEAYGEPPLIQAEEGPVRVVPAEPGGMEIPHRDKLVLQRVPGAEEDPRRERLLPPPEEPLSPPREEPVAAYEPPTQSLPPAAPTREGLPPTPGPRESLGAGGASPPQRPGSVAPSSGDLTPRQAVPMAQKPAAKSESPPPAKTQAPPAQAKPADGPRPLIPQAQQTMQQPAPQQQPTPPRAAASPGSGAGAGGGTYVWPSDVGEGANRSAPPRPEGTKTAETKTPYALPPAAAQPAASGSSTFLVQLAAVSTPEQAQAAWSRLRGNNGDLLAGLSPSYARTDLGAKGVVYRLRAGPVQGETRARALCAQLSGRNVDCMVVRAGG
jgi:hypothetical protein